MADADTTLVAFRFSSRPSTSLNLVGGANSLSAQRSTVLKPMAALQQGPAVVSFRTVRSAAAAQQLFPRRRAPVVLPFASLSFASITPAPATKAKAPARKTPKTPWEIAKFAGQRALAGGVPGLLAMALQVCTLMWLRTTVNYQYRYGTTMMQAFSALYAQGGIPRFYNGMLPALIQGPLSRFGDTAANTGCIALLEDVDMPVMAKTACASASAALFRIFLMPVDAVKTIMQVEGATGLASLGNKIRLGGPLVLYDGALAASLATFVGHYPWYLVYNYLESVLPKSDELPKRLMRSAFMGFCSSFVSDCCSNSIRVIKTSKQAYTVPVTYLAVVKQIVATDGVVGLFGRGLGTKLISNGIQGIMFSVLWRLGQDYFAKQDKLKAEAAAAALLVKA